LVMVGCKKGLFPRWRPGAAALPIPSWHGGDSLRVSPAPYRLILSRPFGSRLFPHSANSLQLASSGKDEVEGDALPSCGQQFAPMARNAAVKWESVEGGWYSWLV
jgi:hypothetical protein